MPEPWVRDSRSRGLRRDALGPDGSVKLEPLFHEDAEVAVQREERGAVIDRRRRDDRIPWSQSRMPSQVLRRSREGGASRLEKRKCGERGLVLSALGLAPKTAKKFNPHLAAHRSAIARCELPDSLSDLAGPPAVESAPDARIYEDHPPFRRARSMRARECGTGLS